MKNTIFVTGHKHPDTDSICAAITYADMLRRCGKDAVACRLGPLNEETKFVLKKFHQENPLLLNDARSTLGDIDLDQPTMIRQEATVHEAWDKMLHASNRSLFATNEAGDLTGIVTTSNLSLVRMKTDQEVSELMSHASAENIAATIDGSILYAPAEFWTSGEVHIITLHSDSPDLTADFTGCICILSDSDNKQRLMMRKGAKCLVVTCGQNVSADVLQEARGTGCAVITTQSDTMHVARGILESYPIEYVMTRNIICFRAEEFVDDVAAKMTKSRVRSYPVLDEKGHVVGAVSRYHTLNYRRREFVLVDHSARNQAINNVEEAHINAIIDHHHIGNIETTYPIFYRNQICGCTCTIISNLYQENGLLPDKDMSGLLLSAILSDTMNFRSATTTDLDRQAAAWLAPRAGVKDIDSYAKDVLSASVALKDSTPHEILNRDLKTYDIGKYRLAIGQAAYSRMEEIQALLPQFRKNLEKEQDDQKVDLMVMMFTNVNAEGTLFVYYGPLSYIVTDVIKTKFDEHFGFDPDIISRKQQLMPKLSAILQSM